MFQGRRALDELNKTLLIAGLVLLIASMFFPYGNAARYVFTALYGFCLVYAVFRLFSKDYAKRYQENLKYLTAVTAVRTFFRNLFQPSGTDAKPRRAAKARKNPTWSEIKQYKYFSCPQCAQRLRVPRGKGKLRVTCTRCGNVFTTKS